MPLLSLHLCLLSPFVNRALGPVSFYQSHPSNLYRTTPPLRAALLLRSPRRWRRISIDVFYSGLGRAECVWWSAFYGYKDTTVEIECTGRKKMYMFDGPFYFVQGIGLWSMVIRIKGGIRLFRRQIEENFNGKGINARVNRRKNVKP